MMPDGECEMPAGSFLFEQRGLAEEFCVSRQQLRDSLVTLEKRLHCITLVRTHKASAVVIDNWSTYQIVQDEENPTKNPEENPRGTHGEPKKNPEGTQEEEVKNIRIEEGKKELPLAASNGNGKPKRRRGRKLLEDAPAWKVTAFEEFWEAVWWQKDVGDCRPVYYELAASPEVAQQINQAALEQHEGIKARSGGDEKYLKTPLRWLKGKGYLNKPVIGLKSEHPHLDSWERKKQAQDEMFLSLLKDEMDNGKIRET